MLVLVPDNKEGVALRAVERLRCCGRCRGRDSRELSRVGLWWHSALRITVHGTVCVLCLWWLFAGARGATAPMRTTGASTGAVVLTGVHVSATRCAPMKKASNDD